LGIFWLATGLTFINVARHITCEASPVPGGLAAEALHWDKKKNSSDQLAGISVLSRPLLSVFFLKFAEI
jgi:hypothetical protein